MPVAIRTLEGKHQNTVTMAVFSPDGESLASTSEDGTAVLWQWRAGKARHVLKGHGSGVLLAAFSPDGKTLGDRRPRRGSSCGMSESGKNRTVIRQPLGGRQRRSSFSRDGKTFITGSSDPIDQGPRQRRWQAAILAGRSPQYEIIASSALSAGRETTRQCRRRLGQLMRRMGAKSLGFGDLARSRGRQWENSVGFGESICRRMANNFAGASLDGNVRIWDAASRGSA